MYQYRAKVFRIVDADTLVLDIDLGLETTRRITIRLALVDAVEKSDPLSPLAIQLVKDWVVANSSAGGWVSISTFKDKREKYGRYLCTIHSATPGSADLNNVLVTKGFAVYKNY
jgi:endonuclease YncB( thermonuclease family)